MTLQPLVGIAVVLGALGGLIGATWGISRVRHIDSELARKIVHIGMGLLVLAFPWIFQSTWPVLVLAGLAISALLILRMGRLRTEGPGSVLLGVERSSLGDIYFPVSVALLFILADKSWLLYCIPLLVLTLADAMAALIGRRWGRLKYTTAGSHKSYEGSLAFVITAFAAVFLPLVTWTATPVLTSTFVAVMVGLVVASLEAISLSGRDNLYIPFVVFVLLKVYLPLSAPVLWLQLVILLVVLAAVVLARRKTTLDDAALLGSALTAYAAYAVGGWEWLIPPFLVFLGYTRLFPNCYPDGRGAHNIHAVVSVTAGGYICLLLFADSGDADWYIPYCLAYGAQLAMIGVASLASTYRQRSLSILVAYAAIVASVCFAALVLISASETTFISKSIILAGTVVVCAGSAVVFAIWQPSIRNCPVDAARWFRQGITGAALALPTIILPESLPYNG